MYANVSGSKIWPLVSTKLTDLSCIVTWNRSFWKRSWSNKHHRGELMISQSAPQAGLTQLSSCPIPLPHRNLLSWQFCLISGNKPPENNLEMEKGKLSQKAPKQIITCSSCYPLGGATKTKCWSSPCVCCPCSDVSRRVHLYTIPMPIYLHCVPIFSQSFVTV